ncbi:unnamed protein product, partial [Dibothriocephalus latus]
MRPGLYLRTAGSALRVLLCLVFLLHLHHAARSVGDFRRCVGAICLGDNTEQDVVVAERVLDDLNLGSNEPVTYALL